MPCDGDEDVYVLLCKEEARSMMEDRLTSGNVPLENTLAAADRQSHDKDQTHPPLVFPSRKGGEAKVKKYSHQQTSLSAGTVTDNDELASNFSHA